MRANYAPRNLVIAAAGNIEHEQFVELAERAFGEGRLRTDGALSQSNAETALFAPAAAPILIERKKELEQAHLIIAAPWPSARSEDRYAASLLASIIGGGDLKPPVAIHTRRARACLFGRRWRERLHGHRASSPSMPELRPHISIRCLSSP